MPWWRCACGLISHCAASMGRTFPVGVSRLAFVIISKETGQLGRHRGGGLFRGGAGSNAFVGDLGDGLGLLVFPNEQLPKLPFREFFRGLGPIVTRARTRPSVLPAVSQECILRRSADNRSDSDAPQERLRRDRMPAAARAVRVMRQRQRTGGGSRILRILHAVEVRRTVWQQSHDTPN